MITLDRKVGMIKWLEEIVHKIFLVFPRKQTIVLLTVPIFIILCFIKELPIRSYTGFKPDIPLLIYYGFFFSLGYVIHHYYVNRLEVFKTNAFVLVIIGLLIVPLIDHLYMGQSNSSVLSFILIRGLFSLQTVALVFGLLGLAIRFLNSENQTIRYISDASYWMYLVHLPLIAGTQLWLIGSPVPPLLRFWVVNIVGMGIPLLTYALFVRYTIIGKMLNGPRMRKPRHNKTVGCELVVSSIGNRFRLPLQKRFKGDNGQL